MVAFSVLLCVRAIEGHRDLFNVDLMSGVKNIKSNEASELKIAIVGAGASGLTLAYALERNLGHKVTVFESNDRVGGKVYSPMIGGESIDVGAVLIESPFTTMLLENECAMPYNDTYEFSVWDPREEGPARKRSFIDGMDAYGFKKYQEELPAWIRVYNTYKYLHEDPLAFFEYEKNMPLYVPFDTFIRENGIQVLGQAFRNMYVLYGYGFGDDVPALYILKFMVRALNPVELAPVIAGASSDSPLILPAIVIPEGAQRMFECLASTLGDVRVNATVTNVTRGIMSESGERMVRVETGDGDVQLYDRVVITTDLMQSLTFLDAREDEIQLFTSIRHNLFTTSVIQGVSVPDFPSGDVGIEFLVFPPNMYQNRSMFPQGFGSKPFHTNASVPTVMCQYDISTQSIDVISQGGSSMTPLVDAQAYQFLKNDAEVFMNASGIPFDTIEVQYTWPTYFPHFGSQELSAGAYETLASLQGREGMYYAGSLFNFETIQGVTDFALALATMIH